MTKLANSLVIRARVIAVLTVGLLLWSDCCALADNRTTNNISDGNSLADQNNKITYRSSQYRYSITYPSIWTVGTTGDFMESDAFSVLDPSKIFNVNVMAKIIQDDKLKQYQQITDVPQIIDDMKKMILNKPDCVVIESGNTSLNNKKAIYFKYVYKHLYADKEVWITIYQVMIINKGMLYTITAKAVRASKDESLISFSESSSSLKEIINTFTLGDNL